MQEGDEKREREGKEKMIEKRKYNRMRLQKTAAQGHCIVLFPCSNHGILVQCPCIPGPSRDSQKWVYRRESLSWHSILYL